MTVCESNRIIFYNIILLAVFLAVAGLLCACGGDSSNTAQDNESSATTEDSEEGLGQVYFREYVNIEGSAKTGAFPFQDISPVNLHELKSDLTPSGRIHYSTTGVDEGNYEFYEVNLDYPYAKLEVRGLYWNDVKGEWSKDSLTLRTLTSFMDEQSKEYDNGYYKRNIDLLGHLMYDRGIYLFQEKGYGFNIAWWQAAQEIMFAFGFLDEATMNYIDEVKRMDIDTGMVENKGKYVEIRDAESFRSLLLNEAIFRYNDDAYLQAIWTLFLGDHSDTEIQKTLDNFIADIRTDGVWDDLQTKADMADWAYELDYSKIQKNLKKRGASLQIEGWIDNYEEILNDFWANVFGLGECGLYGNRMVRQNTNKFSKHYKKYFVCQEIDFKAGWVESEREKVIGPCEEKKAGVISKYDGVFYICRNNFWEYATAQEYDTYGWTAGSEGEIRKGSVDSTNYYVYRNSEWQWDDSRIDVVFGGCTWDREGVIVKADSSLYTDYNDEGQLENKWNYYYSICKSRSWVEATELEYDTYGFGKGHDGEVRAGKENRDKYYVYENGAWRISDGYLENSLGACVASREGEVAKHIISGSYLESGNNRVDYYICKSKEWKSATILQYDTQDWGAGTLGEIRTASYDTSHHYIYRNDEWQYASSIELKLGACVAELLGEITRLNKTYYICLPSNYWDFATPLEYDTYGWSAGNDGEVRRGSVDIRNYYVYENGAWRTSANVVEDELGACVSSREGEIGYCSNGSYCDTDDSFCVDGRYAGYYICRLEMWTKVDRDTLGLTCLKDGSIVNGMIDSYSKYVCDANGFRSANPQEKSLNKGCTIYNEGDIIRKSLAVTHDSVYLCSNGLWNASIDFFGKLGVLTDSRDGKIYKTVTIGTQTWMAENLNYLDSARYVRLSWCYDNMTGNCAKYGRLYTWASAMDSIGKWSTNGKGCGYNKSCTPIYPVRGICPEGWHLPDTTEWSLLINAVGGKANATKILKSENGWDSSNGSDAVHFTALPAGYINSEGAFYQEGVRAIFWSSAVYGINYSYALYLPSSLSSIVEFGDTFKNWGRSVRCIKNQ